MLSKTVVVCFIFIVEAMDTHTVAATQKCPLGFTSIKNIKNESFCYQLKGPEKFDDTYRDCVGNMYNISFYISLNIPVTGTYSYTMWTEYKMAYPEGPYIDWSYTKTHGKLMDHTKLESYYEECVVYNYDKIYVTVNCDEGEGYYRYCLVRPLSTENLFNDGCEGVKGYSVIWSPIPVCWGVLKPGAGINANWTQAKMKCQKENGDLLYKGWRYSNIIDPNSTFSVYPIGIKYDPNQNFIHVDTNEGLVPVSQIWKISNSHYGRLSNSIDYCTLENNSLAYYNKPYNFTRVICEKPLQLKIVVLELTVYARSMFLTTNDSYITKENISCYTDSKTFYPVEVKLSYTRKRLVVEPINDGNYWCIITSPVNYAPTQTKKSLFIEMHDFRHQYYAVKILLPDTLSKGLSFKNVEGKDHWKKPLLEYIYYYSMYVKMNGELHEDLDSENVENKLKKFKNDHPELTGFKDNTILNWRLKKVNMAIASVLVHVELNMTGVVRDGTWRMSSDDATIDYIRPIYNCSYKNEEFRHKLTVGCTLYTCVGDFNEGLYMINTPIDECNKTSERPVITGETPIKIPHESSLTHLNNNSTSILPKILVEDVLDTLTNLSDSFASVSVENMTTLTDKVNRLLDTNVDIPLPMVLLRLLDRVGAMMDLQGERNATIARSNIALVVADADPDHPVKGLRVAERDTDEFQENAFSILRQDVNSSQLRVDKSELVVHLPESVGLSSRRISFVVFRNDRAFQTTNYSINSRVVSINVENITKFGWNEFVEIHWSPFKTYQNRNQTRTCVYWNFLEDNSGVWSQDGCIFIRAAEPGELDTCRCDHLTHFVEVIMPRPVFSVEDEYFLELFTVIGCSLSIIGSIIIGLTAILFRSWRIDFTNKIWLQLSISILLLVLCFLIVVLSKFDTYNTSCMITGIVLHYFVLASFFWMLVAAIVSYRKLVLIFTESSRHKLLKAGAFAWGAPCPIVGALLLVDLDSYARRFQDTTPTGAFCYPESVALWLTVFTPILTILLANWALFCLIIRSVFASSMVDRYGHRQGQNEVLRCVSVSCVLTFLFGLPWAIGIFSFNVIAAYFFTITATCQGFVLFLLFIVVNKKTRDLWLDKLNIKQNWKASATELGKI